MYTIFKYLALGAGLAAGTCLAAGKPWVNPDLQPADAAAPSPRGGTQPAPSGLHLQGDAGLLVTRVCDYSPAYKDEGSGSQQDGAFLLPRVPAGYYIIGGYAQGNYSLPSDCVLAVKPDGRPGSELLLQRPRDWQMLWTDRNSGAWMDGSIWHPVAENSDYVCLGSIAEQGYRKPALNNYVCVHSCLVEYLPAGNSIWSDRGSGASQHVSVYKLHNSNSFYAVPGHEAPGMVRDLKPAPSCSAQ